MVRVSLLIACPLGRGAGLRADIDAGRLAFAKHVQDGGDGDAVPPANL
jgi:hypothetical protein